MLVVMINFFYLSVLANIIIFFKALNCCVIHVIHVDYYFIVTVVISKLFIFLIYDF